VFFSHCNYNCNWFCPLSPSLRQIMVHPVVPVLKETFATVKVFNAALKEQVLLAGVSTPSIAWLDMFPGLLNSEGTGVRPSAPFAPCMLPAGPLSCTVQSCPSFMTLVSVSVSVSVQYRL
jgi:hypothetical protein